MHMLFFLPVVVSLLALGAHFLRYGQDLGVAVALVLIAFLFVRRTWAARTVQIGLLLGVIQWALTLYGLWQMRVAQGAPVARMAIILGVVIAVTAISALLFQTRAIRRIYGFDREGESPD